jgi:hypothetical protein
MQQDGRDSRIVGTEKNSAERQPGGARQKSKASPRVPRSQGPGSIRKGVLRLAVGWTGSSPYVHPFGSPAATRRASARRKTRSFAPPSFGGFALSRMKGVVIQAATRRLASDAYHQSWQRRCCTNCRTRFPTKQIPINEERRRRMKSPGKLGLFHSPFFVGRSSFFIAPRCVLTPLGEFGTAKRRFLRRGLLGHGTSGEAACSPRARIVARFGV